MNSKIYLYIFVQLWLKKSKNTLKKAFFLKELCMQFN